MAKRKSWFKVVRIARSHERPRDLSSECKLRVEQYQEDGLPAIWVAMGRKPEFPVARVEDECAYDEPLQDYTAPGPDHLHAGFEPKAATV